MALPFIYQLVISVKFNIHQFSKFHSDESCQRLTTQSHWAKNTMFPFWKMTKSYSKLPLIRIVGILQLDGNSLTDQIFHQICFTTIVCLSEIAWLLLLNYMISTNTITQTDTLNITYSITCLKGGEEGLQTDHQDKTMPCE